MVNAKGSAETFAEAASTAAVTPRVAVIPQGERTIRGLEDSRDITPVSYTHLYFKFAVGFTLFAGAQENGEYWFSRPKYD